MFDFDERSRIDCPEWLSHMQRMKGLLLKRVSLRISQLLLTKFAILICSTGVLAQGGKAEPLRIEFKPGTYSTTINDKIKDSQEAEYILTARKGQRLTIKLTSRPYRSSAFDLKAPENADLGLEFDANYQFNRVLPATGDYLIIVVRPTTARGTSSYRLVVTVR